MKTMQDCFNIVWDHAQQQTHQSGQRTDFPCVKGAYRSRNGNRCFIGVLIHDRNYDRNLEGLGATDMKVLEALYASAIDIPHIDLMFFSRLQYVHDMVNPVFWNALLEKIAEDFNLTIER